MNDNFYYIDGFSDNNISFYGAYCFNFKENGYNFLLGKNGCSIIIDGELLGMLKSRNLSENFAFKLIQHGLASTSGKPFPDDEYENLCSGKSDPDPAFFIIDITRKCNLNCIYCFRDLTEKTTVNMKTLEDICRYILEYAHATERKSVNIQLWGGEPLLAFECIEYTAVFFGNSDVRANIDIETNGTLITDDTAKRLFQLGIRVGISIDGLPGHQNMQRPLVNGTGSMPLLQKGIDSLRKYYGNEIGGITVITRFNYMDVPEIIRYYIYTLGILNMKFNIVQDNPNTESSPVGLSLNQVREFAGKLYNTAELYNTLGIPFSEANISTRINDLDHRTNSSCCISNGCKGGYTLVSIDMNGNIFPCDVTDVPELKIGSIYDDPPLKSQITAAREKNIFLRKKDLTKCSGCPWIYFCKGGCTNRIRYSGFPTGTDEMECTFNRTVYPEIIRSILKQYSVNGGKQK